MVSKENEEIKSEPAILVPDRDENRIFEESTTPEIASSVQTGELAYFRDLNKFLQKYSLINYGGKTFVLWKDTEEGIVFQSIKDFTAYVTDYHHMWDVEDSRGNTVTKKFYVSKEWLDHKESKRFEGIHFDPTNANPRFFNLWKGWKVKPRAGDIKIFMELIAALCNDDKACMEYLLNYLAHLFQKPEEKPEVAVVMRGDQGIGKGSLMKLLGRIVANYLHLSTSNSLVGQFSGHLMDAYLVFADEAVWAGDKAAEGRLKAMISEGQISIRSMRTDEIQIRSYHRLFVASNEDWAVPVGEGDRRYFVLDCSPRYKGQTKEGQFFARFNVWMDNGGVEAVFDYLLNRDISSYQPRVFPKTDARVDLQLKSLSPTYRFIYELLSGTAPMAEGTMVADGPRRRFFRNKLYADFLAWFSAQKKSYPPTPDDFGKAMSKALGFASDSPKWKTNWTKKTGGKTEYFYQVPSLATAMERFAKNICEVDASSVFFNYEAMNDETSDETEDDNPF